MMFQALELSKRPHIVVATPGRLLDHLRSSQMESCFRRLRFLVLDEADRLITDAGQVSLSLRTYFSGTLLKTF